MIDLYPQDEAQEGGPTASAGVIGEPREEIAEDEGDLAPEKIRAD